MELDELRQRMPELRHREHAMRAELQSIVNQVDDRAAYLRLAETISAFLTRLRTSADSLDVQDRQRIVRLVVKEILVGDDAITIRHAIPIPPGPPNDTPPSPRFHKIADRPKLPFAFRASSHRSWRTSICTTSTTCGSNSGGGDMPAAR